MARTTRKKKQRSEKYFFLSLFITVLILFAAVGLCNSIQKRKLPDIAPETTISTTEKSTKQNTDQLSFVSGIVYRHLVAYNLVCTESGQPLKKYPEYFSQTYSDEIQRIARAWAHRGKSLESVLTDYDSRRYPKLAPEVQDELINLERKMAILVKAQKANTTPDKIAWTQEDENKLNIKDACLLFDDAAPEISEKTDFAKIFRHFMKGI